MALEGQMPTTDQGSGITACDVNPGGGFTAAPDAYNPGSTFLKAQVQYRLTIQVLTNKLTMIIFTDAAGTMQSARSLQPGYYEMNTRNFGCKVQNYTPGSVASYEIWFER
jgi:hypothetical protein